jgi:ABC-type nitrate/sulfonate/bicarbonate transport system substrate-binding protein
VNDRSRALAATSALIEATDYCANHQDDAAKAAAKAFRIPEADMKLYMSRIKYRMEMPTQLVVNNFKEAAEFAIEQAIIKKRPDWSDFIRPQFMKEAAPDRTT